MQAIDQFFDFLERSEHALVNLNPHLALVLVYVRFVAPFVHPIYCSNDFYTQVLAPVRPKIEGTARGPLLFLPLILNMTFSHAAYRVSNNSARSARSVS